MYDQTMMMPMGMEQDEDPETMLESLIEEFTQDGTSPEMFDTMIEALTYILQNPDQYQMVVQKAIAQGLIDADDMPAEFDEQYLTQALQVLQELRARMETRPQFRKGGLASLARHGRGGDTMLAHINSREAEVLRRMGGSGTVNPNTGLHEFKGGGLKKIFKKVAKVVKKLAPIAIPLATFAFPGIGTAIGGALGSGLSTAAQSALGNAVLGGLGGAFSGKGMKGILSGAALGGLGGYAGAGGFGDLGGLAPSATPAPSGTSFGSNFGMGNVFGSDAGASFAGPATGSAATSGIPVVSSSAPTLTANMAPVADALITPVANPVSGPKGFSSLVSAIGENALSSPLSTLNTLNSGLDVVQNLQGVQKTQQQIVMEKQLYEQAIAQGTDPQTAQQQAEQQAAAYYGSQAAGLGGAFGGDYTMGGMSNAFGGNPQYAYMQQYGG